MRGFTNIVFQLTWQDKICHNSVGHLEYQNAFIFTKESICHGPHPSPPSNVLITMSLNILFLREPNICLCAVWGSPLGCLITQVVILLLLHPGLVRVSLLFLVLGMMQTCCVKRCISQGKKVLDLRLSDYNRIFWKDPSKQRTIRRRGGHSSVLQRLVSGMGLQSSQTRHSNNDYEAI